MSTQTDKTKASKTHVKLPLPPTKGDWLKSKIRDVPDFPKPGIVFKDITTLLKDPEAFRFVIDTMAQHCSQYKPDYIAAIEARGFILASAIAYHLDLGFIPVRKPGKLPYQVQRMEYDLEYGKDCLEIHVDAVERGSRVVLIDDLLATGGTAHAAQMLIKAAGAELVGTGFVVELAFLDGRKKLLTNEEETFALITY